MAIIIITMMVASMNDNIYHNPIFIGLWFIVALLGLIAIIKGGMIKRPVIFIMHISFLLILAGALLTHLLSKEYVINLRVGESSNQQIPIEVKLDNFNIIRHPGSSSIKDYVSEITIEGKQHSKISMNNIAKYNGYRLYQDRYDEDMGGSQILIVHDSYGIAVTYFGYILLFLTVVVFFFSKKNSYRRALKRVTKATLLAVIILVTVNNEANAAIVKNRLPEEVKVAFDSLYVYTEDGRITTIGAIGYWDENSMKLFPYADSTGQVVWLSYGDYLPFNIDTEQWMFIRKTIPYIEQLIFEKDYNQARYAISKVLRYQEKNLGDNIPSTFKLKCEIWGRQLNIIKPLGILLLTIGLGLFIYIIISLSRGVKLHNYLHRICYLTLIPIVLLLTIQIVCRSVVSGHLPFTSGYELMFVVTWAAGLFGVAISKKIPVMGVLSTLLCGFGLLISAIAQPNPELGHEQPILNTPLLSIHVGCMMISYTLFALAALASFAGFLVRNNENAESNMADLSLVLIYPAEMLLTAGIFIGAIWANVSWGSYWSWDPKETWALNTMLIYSAVLHKDKIKWLRNAKGFNLFCIFAFAFVLFTWFGVSYLLGGMHSYA